ncbi:hypothetical protein HFD91_04005 [Enterobacteriaceae bacterium EKM102V]|uniref:hypothetical protein n=1 Tax=Pantoea TaxID=53335 RepID=UPI00142DC20D|nr:MULTISPECIES: hypothetical protein [Pantoea]KAF6662738.1 hypothetical protein HFD91_04005 [Enterobacteriaceae bacterium EKM102V]KAF6671204.1 hypothetical protein HFD97_04010 [Pantoea sp. EKM103V]
MRNEVDSITYLITLSDENHEKEWMKILHSILSSPDIEEIPNNPELSRSDFFLNVSKIRLKTAIKNRTSTFGLNDLIFNLEKLPADTLVERYGLKSKTYFGDCFVIEKNIIGCGFVINGHTYSFSHSTSEYYVDGIKEVK